MTNTHDISIHGKERRTHEIPEIIDSLWKENLGRTRSIERTQTPPCLCPLILSSDLDLKSRSRRLMSLDVAYHISGIMMSVNVIEFEIRPLVHFL